MASITIYLIGQKPSWIALQIAARGIRLISIKKWNTVRLKDIRRTETLPKQSSDPVIWNSQYFQLYLSASGRRVYMRIKLMAMKTIAIRM